MIRESPSIAACLPYLQGHSHLRSSESMLSSGAQPMILAVRTFSSSSAVWNCESSSGRWQHTEHAPPALSATPRQADLSENLHGNFTDPILMLPIWCVHTPQRISLPA